MSDNLSHRWLVIVNPAAREGKVGQKWKSIEYQLQANGILFDVCMTTSRDEATELAIIGIEKGYRKIFGVGGDGTNNEIVNGILLQKIVPSHEITYTLLPMGTGNDWIRTHRIPRNLKAWINMLKIEKTTLQDIGWLSYVEAGLDRHRYFANVAGLAYDAFVVKHLQENDSFFTGKLKYFYSILISLWRYQLKPAQVYYDGRKKRQHFYTINAGICKYSGGGMQVVPHAKPNDGFLAMTLAGKLSKLDFIFNSYRFFTGTLGGHSKVELAQVKHMEIDALGDHPLLVEVDGEYLGHTPVEIRIVERALKVLVP